MTSLWPPPILIMDIYIFLLQQNICWHLTCHTISFYSCHGTALRLHCVDSFGNNFSFLFFFESHKITPDMTKYSTFLDCRQKDSQLCSVKFFLILCESFVNVHRQRLMCIRQYCNLGTSVMLIISSRDYTNTHVQFNKSVSELLLSCGAFAEVIF